MQFGKSLVGALLGAAVSVGLLIGAYLLLQIDNVWLAIPFALITGLGVRMLVSTSGHASYARGVMTMLIALAAYIGGWRVVSTIATAKANKPISRPPVAAAEEAPASDSEDGEAKEDTAQEAPVASQQQALPPAVTQGRPLTPTTFGSPWDVIWLAVAALVAYEMGRGTGMSAPAAQPAEPMPVGTHPDA